MKLFLSLALVVLLANGALAQSLSGLSLGDPVAKTKELGTRPVATEQMGPFTIQKWAQSDGNELSVTAIRNSGRIVYLESNWGGSQSGSFTDFDSFTYGETTLVDIRKKLGSNGFAYKSRPGAMQIPGGVIMLNSYEIASRPGTVVTFITKVSGRNLRSPDPASVAKLDTIIIGDANYLDGLWGKEKLYDKAYRKVNW